jgi:hypothetical protein
MPGEPLPSITEFPNPARTTPNKAGEYPARQNHRELPGAAFAKLDTLHDVLVKLFGPMPASATP